ncbi:MAG: hypothetical protein ABSE77_22040, partial [Acidimicrobiales bacterium]
DYIGTIVDECIDLARRLAREEDSSGTGGIGMSAAFYKQYEQQVGKTEFSLCTEKHPSMRVRLLKWP